LMGFAESRLYRFQAVVIAGASNEHLPGGAHDSPFFNEGVRHQLQLPSRYEAQRVRLADFRRLLEAAPVVVLTLSREKDDKPVIPSSWLQRLQALHLLA
jgi:ATP-dependent helicase/nuclease subunit B